MINKMGFLSIIFIAFAIHNTSSAVPISYEGQIGVTGNPFGTVVGSVDGLGWGEQIASNVDFWRFNVGPGGSVTEFDIWATRSDYELDLASLATDLAHTVMN